MCHSRHATLCLVSSAAGLGCRRGLREPGVPRALVRTREVSSQRVVAPHGPCSASVRLPTLLLLALP